MTSIAALMDVTCLRRMKHECQFFLWQTHFLVMLEGDFLLLRALSRTIHVWGLSMNVGFFSRGRCNIW